MDFLSLIKNVFVGYNLVILVSVLVVLIVYKHLLKKTPLILFIN
jgi:hypothetical protein